MHKPIPTTVYDCTCQWCKHPWRTKTDKLPKVCPKCSRTTWDGDQPKSVAEILGREPTPPDAPIERLIVEGLIPTVVPANSVEAIYGTKPVRSLADLPDNAPPKIVLATPDLDPNPRVIVPIDTA